MATCSEYYYAEDGNNNDLPFTAYADLYHKVSGSWVYVEVLTMAPGSLQSKTLTTGDEYKGVAEDVSGWITPDDVIITACAQDMEFTYIEEVSEGDILSGDVQPTEQEEGLNCDFAVTIKNIGDASGHFTLKYYEGVSLLRSVSAGTLTAGQQVDDISEIFVMPDHDFTIQVRIYNDTEGTTDDTYNITCYLISDYYVKVGGNDSLTGRSWTNAWGTINKAATTVPDGNTVHIGFGVYTSSGTDKIAPQNLGASGILYTPETPETGGGTGSVTITKTI